MLPASIRPQPGTAQTIIVSTANPYKFCEAVLDAIGASSCSDRGTNNGTELIDLLHKTTGVPVPEPIGMLRNATVRFSGDYKGRDACMRDGVRA